MNTTNVTTLASALKSMLFSMDYSDEDIILLSSLLVDSSEALTETKQDLLEKSVKGLALVKNAEGVLTSGTLTLNDATTVAVTITTAP